MRSILISLPCSLAVSFFVAQVSLAALNMPTTAEWVLGSSALCASLLIGRRLIEIAFIGLLAILAQLNAAGLGPLAIPTDLLLALLITFIMLPGGLRACGIEPELGRLG